MTSKRITLMFVILALVVWLAFPAGTVRAEAPPPPADDGGAAATPTSSASNAGEEEPDEKDREDSLPPPRSAPDVVASATQAIYQADGALNDANGNPVPMASELARAAMLANGIYICPVGVLPTQMGGTGTGCKTNALTTGLPFASLTEAIADTRVITGWTVAALTDAYTDAGGLTINKAIKVVGEVAFSTFIQNAVNITAPNVTLKDFTVNGQITAANLTGSVTLENLAIYAGAATYGVFINNHNGSVTLRQVNSSGNDIGAYISLAAASLGTVNIINSAFNNCTADSFYACLHIDSHAPVKLENVSASGNLKGNGAKIAFGKSISIKNGAFNANKNNTSGNGYGLEILDQTSVGSGTVSITNLSARGNDQSGMRISAKGSISLSNAALLDNERYGLEILPATGATGGMTLTNVTAWSNTLGGVMARLQGAGSVNLLNSQFNENSGNGLTVYSGGTLTLKNVTAVRNSGGGSNGVFLNNVDYASAPRSVSITNLEVGLNGLAGMQLQASGTTTLNHLDVYSNSLSGVIADNCWSDGTKCRNLGGLSLLSTAGLNLFSSNTGGFGALSLGSGGTITINGLRIEDSSEAININNSLGTGNINLSNLDLINGTWRGLVVSTNGSITLSKVSIYNFGLGAAFLDNDSAPIARSVSISSSRFDHSDNGPGLEIFSKGAVTLNHVTANENNTGATISTQAGVTITSTLGPNQFRDNDTGKGLDISAQGTVSLKDVDASGNANDIAVDVQVYVSSGSVTLNNVITDYSGKGVEIDSLGSISLNKVSASHMTTNGPGGGATLRNNTGSGLPTVTVTNSSFDDNYAHGLEVFGRGAITLNHVSASHNYTTAAIGVRLLNCNEDASGCTTIAPVSILSTYGRNTFDDNDMDNLYIITGGSVILSGVSASKSELAGGAVLVMNKDKSVGNLTISSSQFNGNKEDGLNANLKGSVTLTNVEANSNRMGSGAVISNAGSASAKNITITHGSFNFNNNFDPGVEFGLQLTTKGSVSLNHITANVNNGNGLWIDSLGAVTLSNTLGDSTFDYNVGFGINLTTAGKVNLTGFSASHTATGSGIAINNAAGSGDVVVTAAKMFDNDGLGMRIESKGLVTLSKVSANKNLGVGLWIINEAGGNAKPVSLANVLAEYNQGNNLLVESHSNIILNAVSASYSVTGSGAILNNYDGGAGTGNVQILSSLGANRFEGNKQNGLVISTNNSVSISRATVSFNGPGGVFDGLLLNVHNTSAPVTISCSAFAGNTGSGIEAAVFSPTNLLTLKGVLVGGNTDPVQVKLPAGQTFKVYKMTCP